MHSFISVVIVLLLVLALPPLVRRWSWARLVRNLTVSFFGIMLPLFIFFFSGLLIPDWKGGCPHGWLDCFHAGKLALTPLVLWATGALYVEDILQRKNRRATGVVLGFLTSAVVAWVCLILGLIVHRSEQGPLRWWLLVPFYVAVWYSIRAAQLLRTVRPGFKAYALTFFSSLPFWIGGVIWSRRCYASLPDQSPSCFVATAAGRGHRWLVGPLTEVMHHGRRQSANQQLRVLWHFEAVWCNRFPRSHFAFRRLYNHIGPAVARRINSPLRADLASLALKPVEFLAGFILQLNHDKKPTAIVAHPQRSDL